VICDWSLVICNFTRLIVILSDRGPQPAAFAGWGGEAKDLLFA